MNNKNGKIVNIILLSNSKMIIPLFVRIVSSQAKDNLHSMAFLQIDVICRYYQHGNKISPPPLLPLYLDDQKTSIQ